MRRWSQLTVHAVTIRIVDRGAEQICVVPHSLTAGHPASISLSLTLATTQLARILVPAATYRLSTQLGLIGAIQSILQPFDMGLDRFQGNS